MKINRLIMASWAFLFCIDPAHGAEFPSADDYRPQRFERAERMERVQVQRVKRIERELQIDDDDDNELWQPDMPVRRKRPTLWVLRIEGDKQEYMVPPSVMRGKKLRAGETVDSNMARDIAISMGAKYPPDILEALKKPEAAR